MGIIIGITIFLVGCIVSSIDNSDYRAQRRHKELMDALDREAQRSIEARQKELSVKHFERRRIAKDKEGNLLAEEIVEEMA